MELTSAATECLKHLNCHMFFSTETPEEQEEFFFEITGHKRIVPITKPASSDESFEGSSVCNLYR